jgi:hypothetical protein
VTGTRTDVGDKGTLRSHIDLYYDGAFTILMKISFYDQDSDSSCIVALTRDLTDVSHGPK